MDPVDLAHKLEYAGLRSPVPFITGPEFINSVPGVPVLAALRVFVPPEHWSRDAVLSAAREICRVVGAASQFDIGITMAGGRTYSSSLSINGDTARLTKLDPRSPDVTLRYASGDEDLMLVARFPRLRFEPAGEDFWRTTYAPGAAKTATQL